VADYRTAFVKPYLFSSLPAGTNLNPLTSSQANASPTPLIQIVSSLSLSAVQTIAYPFSSTAVSAKPSESSSRSLRVLTSAPGFKSPLYVVATPTDRGALAVEGSSIWRFSMQPWGKQVDELVSIGLYADALTLLGSLDAGSLDDTVSVQPCISLTPDADILYARNAEWLTSAASMPYPYSKMKNMTMR